MEDARVLSLAEHGRYVRIDLMSDKLVTKPFQNLFCEICGQKVNVSTGEGYWRVDPSNSPWKVLAWHTACLLPWEEE